MFVATVAIESASGVTRIGPRKIEEIYLNRFLGPEYKTYFQHYHDRLRYYDKPLQDAAKAILKELALAQAEAIHKMQLKAIYRKEAGESADDDDFNQLIANLLNDFYIIQREHDEEYVFASKVLCDWWRRYYAF